MAAEVPIVHDISAQAGKNKKISVIWQLPENPDEEITELQIFRSTKQITSFSQIKKMEPIAVLPPHSYAYTDTVEDFSDYYYAVIAVTTEPYDLIMISFNSTTTGVHLQTVAVEDSVIISDTKEKLYPEGTLREIPLPYIDIIEKDIKLQDSLVSDEVAESTLQLGVKGNDKSENLKPYIFEEDLISPDGGDDYLLFNILKTTFIQRKYKEAIPQLERLVGTNICENTRNRAYFYLGECYYFLGDFKKAVKTFVRVESVYPNITKEWLNSSLDKI